MTNAKTIEETQLKVDHLERRVAELAAQIQSLAEAGEYASQGGLITLGILRKLQAKVDKLAPLSERKAS